MSKVFSLLHISQRCPVGWVGVLADSDPPGLMFDTHGLSQLSPFHKGEKVNTCKITSQKPAAAL